MHLPVTSPDVLKSPAGQIANRRKKALFVVLCLALLSLIVWGTIYREPSYQGVSASDWLEIASTNRARLPEAAAAFTAMGSAGGEFLGKELVRPPSRIDTWLLNNHLSIPGPARKLLLKPPAPSRSATVVSLLGITGPATSSALPMLLDWTQQSLAVNSCTFALTNRIYLQTNVTMHGIDAGPRVITNAFTQTTIVQIPPVRAFQMRTQVAVTAAGLVRTNVTVETLAADKKLPFATFQALTNIGGNEPRIIPLLLLPVEKSGQRTPFKFGSHLKPAIRPSIPLLTREARGSEFGRVFNALNLLELAVPDSAPAHESMIQALAATNVAIFHIAVKSLAGTTNDLERIIPLTVNGLVRFPAAVTHLNPGPDSVYTALKQFARHSPLVVPALNAVLPHVFTSEQQGILELLGDIATAENADFKLLKSLTTHRSAEIRAAAWFAWARLKQEIPAEMQGHLELMKFASDETVGKSFLRFAELGPQAEAAVPDLTAYLSHHDGDLTVKAARALGRIGPGARTSLPALERLREHPDATLRTSVEEAIRLIAEPAKAKNAE